MALAGLAGYTGECWFVSQADCFPGDLALTEPPSMPSGVIGELHRQDPDLPRLQPSLRVHRPASRSSSPRRASRTSPARCPACRSARKVERGGGYGRSSSGYGSDYNSGGYGGGYGRAPREMFSATCSSCGNEARVPFQPRGDKPVYCSDCFTSQRSGGGYGGGRGYR